MKTIQYLFIAVLLCFYFPLTAQTFTYFNKTFKPDTMNILSPAVLTVEGGYIMATSFNSLDGYEALAIRKIDLTGNTIWFKIVEEGYTLTGIVGGGILERTNDGHFIMVGAKDTIGISGNLDIIMIKFNGNGDVIWKKTHGTSTTVEGIYQITPTQDGGYIMCGIRRGFSSSGRFYILKTDSFGNKEWDKVYFPTQHGAAFSVFETGFGYIVSGAKLYPQTSYDMLLIGIDMQGNLLWEKNYGEDEGDNACIIMPANNNDTYFLASAVRQNNIPKPYVALIDSTGNILWSRLYDVEVTALQEAPLQISPDGGFLCLYGKKTQSGREPWLWRYTATGDTVWTNTIPNLNQTDSWYLKDIAHTPDGGWVLSGFNYSQQSSWVVKTDSLGYTCSFIGCDSTVVVEVLPGIPSNANQEVSAMVYPVPTSTHLNIHYQIPAGILSSGNAGWYLYDMTGRQVAVETLYGSIGAVQVSVELLPAGVYYYRVVLPASGQTVAGGKVVVE
ncbi:MAG: T9SS type A sorting domain-containing protein [Sphingobacteriales bacterium]|nr:MAG: T9SS type A sorting domain-containing protein [Sphingobacteriales bacterium]